MYYKQVVNNKTSKLFVKAISGKKSPAVVFIVKYLGFNKTIKDLSLHSAKIESLQRLQDLFTQNQLHSKK